METLLKLDRPLAVFDIESTGIMPTRDRIVEIAVLKITPDGESRSTVRRLNPEMPIPAEIPNARNIEYARMTVGMPVMKVMSIGMITPTISPATPPPRESTQVLMRN